MILLAKILIISNESNVREYRFNIRCAYSLHYISGLAQFGGIQIFALNKFINGLTCQVHFLQLKHLNSQFYCSIYLTEVFVQSDYYQRFALNVDFAKVYFITVEELQ